MKKTFPILEGKVAIVTGAAKGMGESTAKLFAHAKAKVVAADVDEDNGQKVVNEINEDGGDAIFVKTDVSDAASVKALVQTAVETYGRLDAAVNNAAITPDNAPVAEFDEHYFDKLISIDLKGVALCMKYELKQFLKQDEGGSIINISSVSGFRPQPNNVAYVGAKHGVEGMTKVAALEYGEKNIRVNTVAPGAIDSPMLRGALDEMGLKEEEFAPQLSLFGRFGQPEEVAQASLWLASDYASYVTGTSLNVDAGYTSR